MADELAKTKKNKLPKPKQFKQKVPAGEFKDVRFSDEAKTHIKLKIGSEEWAVPVEPGDPIYDAIISKGITPTDFIQADMKPAELAVYCDQVLSLAYRKVPADIWEDMPPADKTKWKTYFNKLRNLHTTANLSGVKALDRDAALKLMPKEPT